MEKEPAQQQSPYTSQSIGEETAQSHGLVGASMPPPPLQLVANTIQREEEAEQSQTPEREEAPAFEAITGTTTTENSFGNFGADIARLWRREQLSFSDAARAVADRDPRRGRPDATQSPETEQQSSFSPRWALVLVAWDYQRWGDVPQIRRYLRRGSPFQTAVSEEYSIVRNVENPSAAGIEAQIRQAITDMEPHLQSSQTAELMVYYTGHGGSAGISGVDENSVPPETLQTLAREAGQQGIHITYIFDSCNIGEIVSFAQEDAIGDLREQVNQAPADRRTRLSTRLDQIETLRQSTHRASELIGGLYDLRRQLRTENGQAAAKSIAEDLDGVLSQLGDQVAPFQQNPAPLHEDNEALRDFQFMLLEPMITSILIQEKRVTRSRINLLRRQMAPRLDFLNDLIREAMGQIQQELQAPVNGTSSPATAESSQS
ncbi:MAG: caspase family protein [Bacteroidota bacterium]